MAFTRKTWTGAPDERFTYEDWNRYVDTLKSRFPSLGLNRLTRADMATVEDLNLFEKTVADYWYERYGKSINDTYKDYQFRAWRPGKAIGYKTVNIWEDILWRLF